MLNPNNSGKYLLLIGALIVSLLLVFSYLKATEQPSAASIQKYNLDLSFKADPLTIGGNETISFAPNSSASKSHIFVDGQLRVSGLGLLTWKPFSLAVGPHLVKGCDSTTGICKSKELIVTNSPIHHVIIIFQENHAFDNYFGTYPGAYGFPANICMPVNPSNTNAGCVKPWQTFNASQPQMAHGWTASQKAFDNGRMDGFVSAAGGSPMPMSYYTNATIPYYWDYAHHYVLLDHLFSSALTYSPANHWYEIAGNTPLASIKGDGFDPTTGPEYIDQAQQIPTLADSLFNNTISWMYYSEKSEASNLSEAIKNGTAFYYWNPLFAKNISYTQEYRPHFAFTSTIIRNITQGTLPLVSWVSPTFFLSEHPPADITHGMWYVTDIIDHVMQSRYWNSTLIIVMWDDYGGYYASIIPPRIDLLNGSQLGLGFRVPGIVISPYSKQNYVDHTVYDFESTMKFIEWNFGLEGLTYRDSNASNILNAFNFSQRPSAPYLIPLNQTQNFTIQEGLAVTPQNLFHFQVGNYSSLQSSMVINGHVYNSSDFNT